MADTQSLRFFGIAGDSIPAQVLNVTLVEAQGTVYASASFSPGNFGSASFSPTGARTGTIRVLPSSSLSAGTYNTTVYLNIFQDPSGTVLLTRFAYPVTITIVDKLQVNPAGLSLGARVGNTTQADIVLTPPAGVAGVVSVSIAAPAPAWLNFQRPDANTVRAVASAAGLSAGTYGAQMIITYSMGSPFGDSTVRVPVSFTVGEGLVAPADQTIAMDASSIQAALSGAVTVMRAEGPAVTWTAESSAPWLVLAPTTGSTPSALGYSVDLEQAALLPPYADSTATVSIAMPGFSPVTFMVTLQNRVPFVASALPYGIPAGASSRITLAGKGFTQLSNPAAQLQLGGLTATDFQVLSDSQMAFTTTPASSGTFNIGVSNASGFSAGKTKLGVAPATSYQLAQGFGLFAKDSYLWDPMRRAVYAISKGDGKLYRFAVYGGDRWTQVELALTAPLNMALTPDGSRLLVTLRNGPLTEVDPDEMTVTGTYSPIGFSFLSSQPGSLPFSSDGRMWLPGTNWYFDWPSKSFKALNGFDAGTEFTSFHGSADGTLVLVGPNAGGAPAHLWHLYDPRTGQLSNPMGNLQLGVRPHISSDGSRVMDDQGRVYDRSFAPIGQLPAAALLIAYGQLTLSSDGKFVLAVNDRVSEGYSSTIDVYSTTSFEPGTTNFTRVARIEADIAKQICPATMLDCGRPDLSSTLDGKAIDLISTLDGKAIVWIGNQWELLFPMP